MEGAAGPPTQQPPPPPPPHPSLAPLSFLLGKWRGEGEGAFPSIAPFRYGEEILFSHHPSKPVISYTQKTWRAASGEPMHAESGYWRPRPDGSSRWSSRRARASPRSRRVNMMLKRKQ